MGTSSQRPREAERLRGLLGQRELELRSLQSARDEDAAALERTAQREEVRDPSVTPVTSQLHPLRPLHLLPAGGGEARRAAVHSVSSRGDYSRMSLHGAPDAATE